MKNRIVIIVCALLLVGGASYGDVTVNVVPSSAPNGYGSPSWSGYVTNALNSLENGLGSTGDPNIAPSAYAITGPTIMPGDILVTSFPSWRGVADPSSPFNNELGNRVHFGLHIVGDGTTQFKLNDLTFAMHSNEACTLTDSLMFVGNFVGYSYSATRYGIDWGTNNVKGGGDDTVYTSGNGTTLVDELVYVGVGNAWWPDTPTNPAERQAEIDEAVAWVSSVGPIDVTTTYSIVGTDTVTYTGSGSVCVVPVPAGVILGMLGLGMVGWLTRRRQAKKGQPLDA